MCVKNLFCRFVNVRIFQSFEFVESKTLLFIKKIRFFVFTLQVLLFRFIVRYGFLCAIHLAILHLSVQLTNQPVKNYILSGV